MKSHFGGEVIVRASGRNPREHLEDGVSPQEQAERKRSRVIDWMYRFHVTSGPIIQMRLGTTQRNFLPFLERKGFVRSVDAPGLKISKVWMLTKLGVDVALMEKSWGHNYDTRATSIYYPNLRHDLAVQRAILEQEDLHNFYPGSLLGETKSGLKRPDAIIEYYTDENPCTDFPRHHRCAIEVELTEKKGRELDRALHAAAVWAEKQDMEVRYISHRITLLRNYQKAINDPINIWKKNEIRNEWEIVDRRLLSKEVIARFQWHPHPHLLKGLKP